MTSINRAIAVLLGATLMIVTHEVSAQLLFRGRDYVEIQESRGMLDVNGDFTIEVRIRFDDTHINEMYIAGDEVWPSLSDAIPVSEICGWVLRTSKLTDGTKRSLNFTTTISTKGPSEWLQIDSKLVEYNSANWQHIAVVKREKAISLYWNGERIARKVCKARRFHAAPTPLYLGLRKHGLSGRTLYAQVHSFRVSDAALPVDLLPVNKPFPIDKHTLVAFNFSTESEGRLIKDQSQNGRDGLIEGPIFVSQQE